jgi:tetratricopeptide (TPR) repeat protein
MKKVLRGLLPFLGIILGILLGISGTFLWVGEKMEFVLETATLHQLAFEANEATNQYLRSSDANASIYALEHLIKIYENYFRNANGETISETTLYDFAVSHVRLGNLYEEMGNTQGATENFERGFEIIKKNGIFEQWNGTDKEIETVSDFKEFVNNLDDKLRKQGF